MNEDTVRLLEEVDAGCKMAIDSMYRLEGYQLGAELAGMIRHYKDKHMELQRRVSESLTKLGRPGKEPKAMAAAMSLTTMEFKMFVRGDNHQAAKILMNGCNMGIQAIAQKVNQYTQASKESVGLAKSLIRAEEDLMCDLKKFL